MSQFKVNIANAQYPTDAFATITIASTAGFVVGSLVTAGAVTASVSRIVSATRLVVNGVRGGITITGTLTSASVPAGSATSAFAWGQPKMRDVNGVMVERMLDVVTIDDMGISTKYRTEGHAELTVAARLALSKIQNTDTSVLPTILSGLPAAGTYVTGAVMRFTLASDEYVTFTGNPRIAILSNGSLVTGFATLIESAAPKRARRDTPGPMKMVFEYVVDTVTSDPGQIVSAVYNANGAVITDVGGVAFTPAVTGSVTGILIG